MDIDNLKKVNDTYGHRTGDKVLRQFAKILTGARRQDDIAVRMGEDEFLLYFSNLQDTHIAEKKARCIQKSFADAIDRQYSELRLYRTSGLNGRVLKTEVCRKWEKVREVKQLNRSMIEILALAIEFRSEETGAHVQNRTLRTERRENTIWSQAVALADVYDALTSKRCETLKKVLRSRV